MSKWLRQLVIHGLFLGCLAFWVPYRLGGAFNLWVSLSILLAGWVVLGVLRSFWKRIGLGFGGDLALARISPSFIGMSFAHIGFAFLVLGAVVVTQNKEERDLRMTVGSTEVVGGYQFELLRFQQNMGPNYLADQAVFKVYQSGRSIATLIPEKRRYFSSGQIMTEAAIDAGFWRDLYIALGDPIGQEAWSVRLQYKPMVRWLWLGSLMIGFGALITAFDRRYRVQSIRYSSRVEGVTGVAA